MDCREFWINYDTNGLTPELETHLQECPRCQKEMNAEQALMNTVKDLPTLTAPDHLWDRIASELPEEKRKLGTVWLMVDSMRGRIRDFLTPGHMFHLKPVMIGLMIVVFSVLVTRYYYTKQFFFDIDGNRWLESHRNLEDIEHEYLTAIESLTKQVESSKSTLDPELYDLYNEKLALLDEYIQQCREALDTNNSNPNARYYLALAYKNKMDTLREMAGLLEQTHL